MNLGAVGNFLALTKDVNTDYFMWLADDDWIDAEYVAECVKCLDANPETILAYGLPKYYRDGVFVTNGIQLELLQSTPFRRLLSFFFRVRDNGMFYGVMRRDALASASFPTGFAGDWLFVAQLLVRGKVQLVTNVSIHRSLGGASASIPQLARQCESGFIARRFPFATLGLRVAKLVQAGKFGVTRYPSHKRVWLACVLFVMIAVGKGGGDLLGRALQSAARAFPRLANVIKFKIHGKP